MAQRKLPVEFIRKQLSSRLVRQGAADLGWLMLLFGNTHSERRTARRTASGTPLPTAW